MHSGHDGKFSESGDWSARLCAVLLGYHECENCQVKHIRRIARVDIVEGVMFHAALIALSIKRTSAVSSSEPTAPHSQNRQLRHYNHPSSTHSANSTRTSVAMASTSLSRNYRQGTLLTAHRVQELLAA